MFVTTVQFGMIFREHLDAFSHFANGESFALNATGCLGSEGLVTGLCETSATQKYWLSSIFLVENLQTRRRKRHAGPIVEDLDFLRAVLAI